MDVVAGGGNIDVVPDASELNADPVCPNADVDVFPPVFPVFVPIEKMDVLAFVLLLAD